MTIASGSLESLNLGPCCDIHGNAPGKAAGARDGDGHARMNIGGFTPLSSHFHGRNSRESGKGGVG